MNNDAPDYSKIYGENKENEEAAPNYMEQELFSSGKLKCTVTGTLMLFAVIMNIINFNDRQTTLFYSNRLFVLIIIIDALLIGVTIGYMKGSSTARIITGACSLLYFLINTVSALFLVTKLNSRDPAVITAFFRTAGTALLLIAVMLITFKDESVKYYCRNRRKEDRYE